MRYEIQGGALPVAVCHMQAGERLLTHYSSIGWMSASFSITALDNRPKEVSGNYCMLECQQNGGLVAFPSNMPGAIMPFQLAPGQSILYQRSTLLCAAPGVERTVQYEKPLRTGLVSVDTFVLDKITGPGLAMFMLEGASMEYTLKSGEQILADVAHVGMMDDGVRFSINPVRPPSGKNSWHSGEPHMGQMIGPGRVWIQTMPVARLTGKMASLFKK